MCDSERYATREEIQSIFGEMINFPPEVEAEANRLWLERGLADGSIKIIEGINLYEI